MKIRSKIILVVLPVIVVTLFLAGAASYFAAMNGVTRVARQLLHFKARELEKYAENQWELLTENGFSSRPDMIEAAKTAVENYARSIILSDSELIFAIDENGNIAMSTSSFAFEKNEPENLIVILREENESLLSAMIGGRERIFRVVYFTPFQWYMLLTEDAAHFYRDANLIRIQTTLVLIASLALSSLLLILFAQRLTMPLSRVVNTMNGIISGAGLDARVEVEFRDETGRLASAFNHMLGELEKAYAQIKRYAFDAVLAGKKEQRIRQIFQKYVPKDVIDKCFTSQGSMLKIGEDRNLAILFSDIRGFTTISEKFKNNPEDLVESLNRYFSGQVDIIMNRSGIVDKYIGDAIMAFWGAPVYHDDDCLQSVLSGLDMIDALTTFNNRQKSISRPEFQIGIGINYGLVTVGNIGSERKMDYTVIGDEVNLASRMEGLTKAYKSELLITDSVYRQIKKAADSTISCRLLDKVAVKGKNEGVRIYTVKRNLSDEDKKAWAYHNKGMELYFSRDFNNAGRYFKEVLNQAGGDYNAAKLLERCKAYTVTPPPSDWDGVEVMLTK